MAYAVGVVGEKFHGLRMDKNKNETVLAVNRLAVNAPLLLGKYQLN